MILVVSGFMFHEGIFHGELDVEIDPFFITRGNSLQQQLVVKVRGHVDGLSGDHCLLQTVRSIHHYVCKQKKTQKNLMKSS